MKWRPPTTEEIKNPEAPWFAIRYEDPNTHKTYCSIETVAAPSSVISADVRLSEDVADYIIQCVNECKQRQLDEECHERYAENVADGLAKMLLEPDAVDKMPPTPKNLMFKDFLKNQPRLELGNLL